MPFDIELNVLQNSVKESTFSKTAVHLQIYLRETPSQVVVTLKYYYQKNISVVETTFKCLFFKVPLELSLDIQI